MNVTSKGHKILGAFLFLAFLFATSASSAWHGGDGYHSRGWHHHGGGGWHWHNNGGWHHGWGGWGGGIYVAPSYNTHHHYRNCGWVGGHWRDSGYWVPAHRVCWY
ncbi:MAG: hypothetical protein H0U73_04600 [Tatlockia sp.]|nr:hypothetical protein [Tatlockia sp.]